MEKKLKLTEILPKLKENPFIKPYVFINSNKTLQQFFQYKARLIDINNLNLQVLMERKSYYDIGEEIRKQIVMYLAQGYWIVFDCDTNYEFNIKEFFTNFEFVNSTKDFFDNSKILDKQFMIESGILKENEDVDSFGNSGYYKILDIEEPLGHWPNMVPPQKYGEMCILEELIIFEDLTEFGGG